MRYREKYNDSTADVVYRGKYCVEPSCPSVEKAISYIDSKTYIAMLDVNTPEFKRLSAEGQVINSPMIQEYYSGYVDPTYWTIFCSDPVGESGYDNPDWNEQLLSPLLLSAEPETAVDDYLAAYETERNIAIAQAWANVDISEMQALASLGELPETIKWVGDLYRRGIGIFAMFKSRKVRLRKMKDLGNMSAVDYADAVANFWLEFRYAVRPLLFEMEQIVAALQAGIPSPRRTARGYHDKEVTDDDSGDSVVAYYTVGYETEFSRESIYRAGVLYSIDALSTGWTEILGLDQPLESLWELTKLSFAIDWFLNVGDIISAHTTSGDLTPLASWIVEEHTFKYEIRRTDWDSSEDGHTYDPTRSNLGKQGYTHVVKRRSINTTPPYIPAISINLDWLKLVDLAALARSIYRAIRSAA